MSIISKVFLVSHAFREGPPGIEALMKAIDPNISLRKCEHVKFTGKRIFVGDFQVATIAFPEEMLPRILATHAERVVPANPNPAEMQPAYTLKFTLFDFQTGPPDYPDMESLKSVYC